MAMQQFALKFRGPNVTPGIILVTASSMAAAAQAGMRYFRENANGNSVAGLVVEPYPDITPEELANARQNSPFTSSTENEEQQFGEGGTGADPDTEDTDGGYGDQVDPKSGLEGSGAYYPAYLRAMKQSGRDIQGPGLWAQTQRNQFEPAFATYQGQDILAGNPADQTDQDRQEAFQRYVQSNGQYGYANKASDTFKRIDESGPIGGQVDLRDPSLVEHINLYRNPVGGDRSLGDNASLAEKGYNLARAGSRTKRSAMWDKYLPSSSSLYSGWLADTNGEPTDTTDWFDYLRKAGVA